MSVISIVRIAPRSDGRFDFDSKGDEAFVIRVLGFGVEMIGLDQHGAPVEGEVYDIVDLLAWLPDAPGNWWMRRGDETPILGARALALAVFYGDPITLHQNPQEWLAAGRRGVCILKWSWPLDNLFEGVGAVECDSPQLQERFVKALRRWEPPVFVLREVRDVA